MAPIKSQAEKFKRVEVTIRQTLQNFTKATIEIDKALQGKRTSKEIELLESIKEDWNNLHKQAQDILMRLYR